MSRPERDFIMVGSPLPACPCCGRIGDFKLYPPTVTITRGPTDVLLVAAIADATQGRPFTSAELVRHAAVDDHLREVLGPMRPKQIGRRLGLLQGLVIARRETFLVERIKDEQAGTLWVVCRE